MNTQLNEFIIKLSKLCKEHNYEIKVSEKSELLIVDKDTKQSYPAIIR
ncbi:MAG: hypothetical protein RR620_08995 [Clostridium sp.]